MRWRLETGTCGVIISAAVMLSRKPTVKCLQTRIVVDARVRRSVTGNVDTTTTSRNTRLPLVKCGLRITQWRSKVQ